MVVLLAAPLGARAQQSAPPAMRDEGCSVPADIRWTPQEKFVWERVCVGKDADFNAQQDYGGKLDPRSQMVGLRAACLSQPFFKRSCFRTRTAAR
jgi:hypothetical protein